MCNLYNGSPKGEVEVYLRPVGIPDYKARAVAKFGTGMFLRPRDGSTVRCSCRPPLESELAQHVVRARGRSSDRVGD